jgi:stage V sporulation protein D (sporulation-specific penicillin-binding protein)
MNWLGLLRTIRVMNGASAIVMDPRNGDILAMVSKPDFDPNNPRAVPQG